MKAIFLIVTLFISTLAIAKENIHQVYNSQGNYEREPKVLIFHDDKRGVTCYVFSGYYGRSASCIADSQLKGKKK
ncbi:MAG TPA: hypothetical protein PLF59_08290 [Cyclobacteriaceae bacterium]|nr:hypothetical protein [Cyclobacteriaceae bacterium]